MVLVAIGDVPLVPRRRWKALVADARSGKLAVLTANVSDPSGLGRIVRDAQGGVRAIVEERDADAAAARDREINTGVMAAPAALVTRGWAR